MDIQKWKEFSDAVDVFNEKKKREHYSGLPDFYKEDEGNITWLYGSPYKSIENFYEWQCGKLNLDI